MRDREWMAYVLLPRQNSNTNPPAHTDFLGSWIPEAVSLFLSWVRTGDREVTAPRTRREIRWVSTFVFHSCSQDANCSVWINAIILERFRALRLRKQSQQHKHIKEINKQVNKRGMTINKKTVLLLTVFPGCWVLINECMACSCLLSKVVINLPMWRGGRQVPRLLATLLPWWGHMGQRELMSHRQAATFHNCFHDLPRPDSYVHHQNMLYRVHYRNVRSMFR